MPLSRWIAELGRREAVRGRDHDGLEAEIAELGRRWDWSVQGRSERFGDGLLRADVLLARDEAKAELDAFRARADADLAARLREELRPLVARYQELLARAGKLDFLDLLLETRDLLRDDRGVRDEMRARFTHFFVDEFQDTDPLQVEILWLLAGDDAGVVVPGKLFVVGDPKQAIYRFRRADVAVYEQVKRRLLAQGARLVDLSTSFRAVPAIQAAVNAAFEPVMRGDGQARYVPLAPNRAAAELPPIVALPVPRPYAKRIANFAIEDSYPDAAAAFVEHLGTIGVAPRDVCLMFRRFQSYGRDLTRPYVRALEARGIPHVLVGGRSFHEREEIEAVRTALTAIEWPDDELAVYATLRGPLFAIHDEDLLVHQVAHGLHPLQPLRDSIVSEGLGVLAALHRERNRRPIADTLSRLLAATRAHASLAMWPAGEQALANVLRVLDLARRFEARGASSFRAFVERLATDAERGKHPEAPTVEDGTEGVRVMTVHAAKGLEFRVVVLCDPTAPGRPKDPSRYIDGDRFLQPLAGCVPIELHEHADDVLRRDREEIERLAYVAATRARDMLVVPVVGDEERKGTWLEPLAPVVYPARWRAAEAMPGFGADSVVERPWDRVHLESECVMPGRHVPRAGDHAVVWWDPRALALDKTIGGGMRQRQLLESEPAVSASRSLSEASGPTTIDSAGAYAAWQARLADAMIRGARPSVVVATVTEAALEATPDRPVAVEHTSIDRGPRPAGKRFGSLVHATLAAIALDADRAAVRAMTASQARLLGAPDDEISAAVDAVVAALAHPLLRRAAAARELRREVPVILRREVIVEGVVDLAFGEPAGWTVVDFKTDQPTVAYEAQVALYAAAIEEATGLPAAAVLLVV